MQSRISSIFAALAVLLIASVASAAAPATIPMQGYITDAEGAPLVGQHAFEVSIFADSIGGTALFTDQQMVDVDNGYFTFYVGRGDALDLALFRDNGTLFLGVTIDDDAELAPRTELGSVPFAAYAEHAGSIDFDDIVNVPAELADGDAVLTAGNGLTETSRVLDVDTATIQARVTGVCGTGEAIRSINEDGTVVCESASAYAAGTGITLNANTFSADTSVVQARVVGTCGANQKLLGVNADGTVNCAADIDTDTDTDTNTTYSAGGGLALIGTTFSANTSVLQARVSSTCPVGQSIRTIAANGSVTCEIDTDTNTTYAAGSGLSLTGTTFSVNTAVVQSRVTGSCAPGQSIRAINANGTVTCEIDTDTNIDTTYTAGNGLSLTGTSFSMDVTGKVGTSSTAQSGTSPWASTSNWLGLRFRIDGSLDTGRLEFSQDGGTIWGTVCDDYFSDNSARVACRSMGYADGTMVTAGATTDGADPILLDDFQCNADARNLMECRIRPIGAENCSHGEDVGVSCIP